MAMESPMTVGKRVEDATSDGCFDRISSLPDELLGRMHSFLPTTSAVSTSILSMRWRYLFTLTNSLSFDSPPCFVDSKEIEAARKERFNTFVYKVLELHQISPLKTFSITCELTDKVELDAWFSTVVQKGVQEIHFSGCNQEFFPDCLFMCETLVRLELKFGGCHDIEIPLSTWLPKLKILHLEFVGFFDCESVERLVCSCGLLEKLTFVSCECDGGGHGKISTKLLKVLTIDDCTFEGLVEIDAPNLAYLTYNCYRGVRIVPSWKYACSFVKAELIFSPYRHDYILNDSFLYDRGLLQAAAFKVIILKLLSYSVQGAIQKWADFTIMLHFQTLFTQWGRVQIMISDPSKMCHRVLVFEILRIRLLDPYPCRIPVPESEQLSMMQLLKLADNEQMLDFPCLTTLSLGYCPYDAWKYVTSLLGKSPQLETICFERGFNCCRFDTVEPQAGPPDVPLIPFSCHVKEITVRWFCGHEGSLTLLGHLLRNAGSLKKVTVYKCHCITNEKQLLISKRLFMLPRASGDCCIELRSGRLGSKLTIQETFGMILGTL